MKNRLTLSTISLFLFFVSACKLADEPKATEDASEILAKIDTNKSEEFAKKTIKDTAVYEEQFSEHFDYFPLQDIYENWVQLTDIDGETVVYKPCEIQNPSIWINYFPDDGGSPIILLGFGQDSEQFDILTVEKKEEDLLIQCAKDITIIYHPDSNNKKIAFWTIPHYFNRTAFVAKDFENEYKKIEEDCDYLY